MARQGGIPKGPFWSIEYEPGKIGQTGDRRMLCSQRVERHAALLEPRKLTKSRLRVRVRASLSATEPETRRSVLILQR
eukprot:6178895-Pleurochrysis_carterae.AAC.7